jgi:hypothetical protein
MLRSRAGALVALVPVCLLGAAGVWYLRDRKAKPADVLDEARLVNHEVSKLGAPDEDYFHDMDGALPLTPEEVKGRNTWIVWSGGNDRFWDTISRKSVGTLDFLKTLSSHPKLKASRDNRWRYLGLVNEPCFEKATAPNPDRFGLWLDKRKTECPPDPFENEAKYAGVKIGARGRSAKLPVGSYFGFATGVVGLRLFPNPDFDAAAEARWDAERYYTDPDYYLSKDLVKPYRVGMSCGFCHVGPDPVRPPADPENPEWANLSSVVGAQYFWVDRIFNWEADPTSFAFQLFHTSRPGALDTSLVSTDNINNPRTMNAVYQLGPRLEQARRWGKETLGGGSLNNAQLNDYVKEGPLTLFFEKPATVWTPRVLKDGADSVGALGALNRVYINIGLFSEEWLRHFNALVGGKKVTPIEIAVARKNSHYWLATEAQTPNMALFFLKSTAPHKLADAPGGKDFLATDQAKLTRGRQVFAETCARCHSSKLPAPALGVDPHGCGGPGYLDCFWKYWEWTKTDEFKSKMRDIVMAEDFLEGNFLSSDLRIPVTLLETNACSPLATNAIAGNIWDNFSSQTYKDLPSVGEVTVHHPFTGEPRKYHLPGGGRGFTRPASLVSVWSTAPFLLNNTLGCANVEKGTGKCLDAQDGSYGYAESAEPSVEARLRSFDDSIEKLLWPEKREKDPVLGDKVPGVIDRTTASSYLRVASGYLPDLLRPVLSPGEKVAPWLVRDGGIEIGPIPKGTPVNLLSNLLLLPETDDLGERLRHDKEALELVLRLKRALKSLPAGATDEQAREAFTRDREVIDGLIKLSKCPDFVVNRGHYFGTGRIKGEPALSDPDKRALIEYLKTF